MLDCVDPTSSGFVWVGHIAGFEVSTVSLASEDGVMSGFIQYSRRYWYSIRYTGGGLHSVAETPNQSALPPGAEPLLAPAALAPADVGTSAPQGDDATIVDVLVVYTRAAVSAAGGTSSINALIANAVSLTNTSYANSDVVQRIRLVRAEPVAYTESGSFSSDLTNLTNGSGTLAGVPALRNTYRADMVAREIRRRRRPCAALAWLMTSSQPVRFIRLQRD